MQVTNLGLRSSPAGRIDTQAGHRATDDENLASLISWRTARRNRLTRRGQDPQIDYKFRNQESETTILDICGTIDGLNFHKRAKETPCAPCKAANARRERERRARIIAAQESEAASKPKRQKNPPHGSPSRYQAHRREGETPCDKCRAGHAKKQSERRARQKKANQ